jgi:hypothetical protein
VRPTHGVACPSADAVVSLEEDKTKLHITRQLMRLMHTTKVRACQDRRLCLRCSGPSKALASGHAASLLYRDC